MLRLKALQTGETIIEVLISLTVLGLVLGFSYALASRSLRGSQDAQERTMASQKAQSMIEVVKTYALEAENMEAAGDTSMSDILFPAADRTFCLDLSLSAVNARTLPVAPPNVLCGTGLYSAQVEVHPVTGEALPTFDYTARVTWASGVSGGDNEAAIRYRWVRVPAVGP